jgi:hypothetical protein
MIMKDDCDLYDRMLSDATSDIDRFVAWLARRLRREAAAGIVSVGVKDFAIRFARWGRCTNARCELEQRFGKPL